MAEAATSEKVLVELGAAEALAFLAVRRGDAALISGQDKLRAALNSTQQQFDLSTFRKEVEERMAEAEKTANRHLYFGHDEEGAEAEGWRLGLDWVLALLPGEEEGA